jgi:hypothetical protein
MNMNLSDCAWKYWQNIIIKSRFIHLDFSREDRGQKERRKTQERSRRCVTSLDHRLTFPVLPGLDSLAEAPSYAIAPLITAYCSSAYASKCMRRKQQNNVQLRLSRSILALASLALHKIYRRGPVKAAAHAFLLSSAPVCVVFIFCTTIIIIVDCLRRAQ